jgi:pimeloyl-ACP methyl ester carboxylesterase
LSNTTLDLPAEGHMASVNGMEMYYEIHGDGPPLVLLHGFFGWSGTFEQHIPELAPHFRIIAIDLRGHGRSTNPAGQFTHRQAALDVYALLDQLGIDRFKGFGFSSGG